MSKAIFFKIVDSIGNELIDIKGYEHGDENFVEQTFKEMKIMYFKPHYKIGKGMGSIELVNNNNNDLEDCFSLTEHELIMAIKDFEDNYC